MNSKEWAREMALYGKWQNEGLYALCGELGESERQRDRGMFFGSIHATLDHILMVDRTLLDFATSGKPAATFDPKASVAADFESLSAARTAFDDDLLALIDSWSEAWLHETLTYTSARHGGERSVPRTFPLCQMFNHATHHRSQVTAALHKLGLDYGNTDMPFNPYSQYRARGTD